MTAPSPLYVHACAGIGPDGRLWSADAARSPRTCDAPPLALKPLIKELAIRIPRVASRFAELAVLGAHACLQRLPVPLDATSRLYLATGLGDVARTDALYYQVMPPSSEVASPAHFATSGNNMAGFFVAQHAGLRSRNLTFCADALSLEAALSRARSDLHDRATPAALVGSVDETTVPREFYVRRFALRDEQRIGEASGWFVLSPVAAGAIGEVLDVHLWPTSPGALDDSAVAAIAAHLHRRLGPARSAPSMLLAGCRLATEDAARIAENAQLHAAPDYLPGTGVFPTAVSLALIEALQSRTAATIVHANRDDAGRTGLVVLRSYCR